MSLVEDFERDMRDGARRCREFGYNPTYWEKMVSDQGAVGAAKQLLKAQVLFSTLTVSDLLDPAIKGKKSARSPSPLSTRLSQDH